MRSVQRTSIRPCARCDSWMVAPEQSHDHWAIRGGGPRTREPPGDGRLTQLGLDRVRSRWGGGSAALKVSVGRVLDLVAGALGLVLDVALDVLDAAFGAVGAAL